ncbi:hypothetical protein KCP73_21540 [Salmonella enterica subsp. enterica]|nr:hypothetical protein KCP73_21540 [Salmonella enterica subsp. enterica]
MRFAPHASSIYISVVSAFCRAIGFRGAFRQGYRGPAVKRLGKSIPPVQFVIPSFMCVAAPRPSSASPCRG